MFLQATRLRELFHRNRDDNKRKRMLMDSSVPYYMLTFISIAALLIDRPNPYLLIVVAYVGIALLDEILALDTRNPSKQERLELQRNDAYFRFPLCTTVILSWALFFKNLKMWSTMEITMETLPFMIGLALIAVNYNTAQFVVAHELIHKPGKYYRLLGTLHVSKFFYSHLAYHHLHCHHIWVGTPLDPSHTKKGENVYKYAIRSAVGSWKGVYRDQKSAGKPFFGNMAILSLASTLVITSGIQYFYGTQALVIHVLIAFLTIFYLQATAYIQHYGLERKKLENGEYEKINIYLSWNARQRFTNYFFFKSQRHSDHHQNSSKPYQTLALSPMEEAPCLPHGYIFMAAMTLFPKVWFKVMDPLVDEYRRLKPEAKGKIDPKVMENSIAETRKFLVEISLASFFLLTLSLAGIL